jgi:DNA-binding protein Fis
VIDHFDSQSMQVQNIIKGFNLTKSLYVSTVLIGEPHTGKKTLVRYLFPTIVFVDGEDQKQVEAMLKEREELVIINFEKLSNIESLDFDNKRVIAIADYIGNERTIDNLFAFIYKMPSLRARNEDILLLANKFAKEAKSNLMTDAHIVLDPAKFDLSSNIHSLRRSVYQQVYSHTCSSREIHDILYHYLYHALGSDNDYKAYLPLYEEPLIRAGLQKFGSQLKLASILGINRNTLRKKIYELGIQ